jgi:3-methyl-2-oxobutanoate hydroxymethyltransferase
MKTIIQFFQNKKNKEKISVITCYDASFARLVSKTNIDCILVGDSLGMVIQGFNSTVPVTLDEMIYHTKSVKRGSINKYVI